MSNTAINAFQSDLDLAKQELVQAQGRVDTAEAALKAHPDYKAPAKVAELDPKKASNSPA